jgi:high-affinity nickel-transport protein
MCLLDTTDGALMMTLYTSTALARDQIAVLYYSIVLTVITIVVAMVIGVIQLLSLVRNVAEPNRSFWDGVEVVEDWYDVIGVGICVSFVVFGGLSVLLYKPWRAYVDQKWRAGEDSEAGLAEGDALLARDSRGGEGETATEWLEEDTSLQRPE